MHLVTASCDTNGDDALRKFRRLRQAELSLALGDPKRADDIESGAEEEPSAELLEAAQALWQGKAQHAFSKKVAASLDGLPSNAAYLASRALALCESTYSPNIDDILNVRKKTTGVQNANLTMSFNGQSLNMDIYDPGGQRNLRRKWLVCSGAASISVAGGEPSSLYSVSGLNA